MTGGKNWVLFTYLLILPLYSYCMIMKKLTIKSLIKRANRPILFGVLAIGLLSAIGVYATTTMLSMQIVSWSITIGSPTALSFTNTITSSNATQSLEQDFSSSGTNSFYVQDLKGTDSGYNTTLQLSGGLAAGSNSGTPTLLSGMANARVVLDSWSTAYQNFSSARTFITRAAGVNNGTLGQYGAQIWLRIDIPAWQAAGTYTTSLVYTLIEN